MIVIGAGMAGLLAAAMLREECNTIFERQGKLPNNHHALLRFPSSTVGDVLGIPFRKVKALKAVAPFSNPVADAIHYSRKCLGGQVELRSITSAGGEIEDRYIAPPDFIQQMVNRVPANIEFDSAPGPLALRAAKIDGEPYVSTIPMPALMDHLDWPYEKPDFNYVGGIVLQMELPPEVDIHVTLYVPAPEQSFSRISITGRTLIIECPGITRLCEIEVYHNMIVRALELLGLPGSWVTDFPATAHKQQFMKILPIDEAIRRRFMIWATDNFNIYSLGRFATWRPGLLLDDVVKDVRAIQRMIQHGNYKERLR